MEISISCAVILFIILVKVWRHIANFIGKLLGIEKLMFKFLSIDNDNKKV